MHLTSALTLFAYAVGIAAGSGLAFNPLQGHTVVFREKTNNGSLVWFDTPKDRPSSTNKTTTAHKERRAPQNCPISGTPACDNPNAIVGAKAHAACNALCDQLVTELNADAYVAVPKSPRSICYMGDAADTNELCRVSWHKGVDGLTKGDLAAHAGQLLQTCTQKGVSGKTHGVRLGAICTDVCLSNRPDHC